MTGESLLQLALGIPTVAAILIALLGRWPNVREGVTLLASGALLLTVLSLAVSVLGGARPELGLVTLFPGMELRLALEPLGMLFALVAAILWPVNSLYSIGYMRGNGEKNQTRFYVCFAIALASVMGLAFSGNLLTLFVFYEVLTLSTYPLVTHHGTETAMKGGRTYMGILLGTSIGLFLIAIVWTWIVAGTLDFTPGGILAGRIGGLELGILLALFIFGIGKAAVMPVHRWLPAAMVAPTPVSALLHAVAVVKAGVFTVVKVVVYIFGLDLLAGEAATSWLLYIAGFTVIAASVVALRVAQNGGNLKRMLAYSTIGQLSYVVLAAAVFAPLSAMGAALHIIAHAFGKITLFFAAGSIYTAAHKTEISQLNGIGRKMPWTMGAFAVGSISMIGLPPTGGFLSKWYMFMGAVQASQFLAAAVIIGSTLLNAAYFGPIVYAAFFRTEATDSDHVHAHAHGDHDPPRHGDDHHPDHGEAPLPVVAALVITASLSVLLFFFPDVPLALVEQMLAGPVGGTP